MENPLKHIDDKLRDAFEDIARKVGDRIATLILRRLVSSLLMILNDLDDDRVEIYNEMIAQLRD